MADEILSRIHREHGEDLLEVLSSRLSPTDLQSLLLEVYRRRALRQAPGRLLAQHEENRFVRPSPLDPRVRLGFDRVAFSLASEEFEPIELAPMCPLGTTSAVTTVSQNNLVSTARNTEVMADPTNAMALECALRRRKSPEPVRLCCSERVTRAQGVSGPQSWAHFRLFALVSAGRDEGAYRFESAELARHIGFYLRLFPALGFSGMAGVRAALTNFVGDEIAAHHDVLLADLSAAFPGVEFGHYPERETGRGYYVGSCFHIYVRDGAGEEYFLADGGVVDWTQKLLSNKKERFLISGIGTERLCSVFGGV